MKIRVLQAAAAMAIALRGNDGLAGEGAVVASIHRMLEDQRVTFDALRHPTRSVGALTHSIVRLYGLTDRERVCADYVPG